MTNILVNRWFHFLILLVLLVACVVFSGSDSELRKRLQYVTFDTFNQLYPREKSDQIVIIDIDEESLKKMGQFPWPRNVMAQMVDELAEMGASSIAFDVVFAEKDRTSPESVVHHFREVNNFEEIKNSLLALPAHDQLFAESIRDAGNVVTGFTRAKPGETLRAPYQNVKPTFLLKDKTPFEEYSFAAPGVATNLPEFSQAAAGNGSFMATPDIDGLIREVSLLVKFPPENTEEYNSTLYPMLGIEALRVHVDPKARFLVKQRKNKKIFDTDYLISLSEYEIPVERNSKLWVYYRHISDDEYIPAWKLYDESARKEVRDKIQDKIVFVGTSAEGLRDIRSTPLDIFVPGVEVHVNVVEQILQGKFLQRPDLIVGVEALIIAGAGLLIILLAPFVSVIWLGFFALLMMGGMFFGSWNFYTQMGLLLDPVYPSISLSALFLVSSLLSYLRIESERKQVREAFGLYISPDFMEELENNPDKLKLGGEVRDLTVMFTDIRSFTTISESLSPEELIQLMNDFLTPMSDLVMENRGTIDKYMGDAMMAFWNAPLEDSHHARNACLSALRMNEALVPINEAIKKKAQETGQNAVLLNAGIGINTGPCSVGNMGSRQRFAYSALGDAVNLASRLEGQTKAYGVQVLVGEETVKAAKDLAFLELDLIKVKGKEQPARIYTLLGNEIYAKDPSYLKWKTAHEGMLAAYRAGDFDCAAQDLKEARELAGDMLQGYYDLFSGRIGDYLKTPPPDDWDGVFEAKTK